MASTNSHRSRSTLGRPRSPEPVVLIVAVFSRYDRLLESARNHLQQSYGAIHLASEVYPFIQTRYYETTMGTGLQKQLLAFRELIDPARLSAIKLHTIDLEEQLIQGESFEEERPLNLDPGILSLGKFMLATTKDQAHRIYLQNGIYAEVTLQFRGGRFEPWPWTYADYRQESVCHFLEEARAYCYAQLRGAPEEES